MSMGLVMPPSRSSIASDRQATAKKSAPCFSRKRPQCTAPWPYALAFMTQSTFLPVRLAISKLCFSAAMSISAQVRALGSILLMLSLLVFFVIDVS